MRAPILTPFVSYYRKVSPAELAAILASATLIGSIPEGMFVGAWSGASMTAIDLNVIIERMS